MWLACVCVTVCFLFLTLSWLFQEVCSTFFFYLAKGHRFLCGLLFSPWLSPPWEADCKVSAWPLGRKQPRQIQRGLRRRGALQQHLGKTCVLPLTGSRGH